MKDKETAGETFVRSVFRDEFQLEGEKLSTTSETNMADYLLYDGTRSSYLVEVKEKFDSEEWQDSLEEGGASKTESLGHSNVISKTLTDAATQLENTPRESDFKLIAIYAQGFDDDTQIQQIEATIYGIRHLRDPETDTVKPCYYFGYSDFYRMEHVDAILICTNTGCALCINPYSAQSHDFEKSQLATVAASKKCLIRPHELEKEGRAYICDSNLHRNKEKPLLEFLTAKYKLKRELQVFDLLSIRGAKKVLCK